MNQNISLNYKINNITKYKEIIVLLLTGFLIWILFFTKNYYGLGYPDAFQYASIARNLINRAGYLVNMTTPFNVAHMGDDLFYPVMSAPLFPIIIFIFYKIFGVREVIPVVISGIFFILSIIPVYLISNKLFGKTAAVIISVAFIVNPTILEFSILGITELTFVFFVLFSFLFLILYLKNNDCFYYCFLSGVSLGVASLARVNGMVFALLMAGLLFFKIGVNKNKTVFLFILGISLMQIPSIILHVYYKYPTFSGRYFMYGAGVDTRQYPALTIMRMLNPLNSWQYICIYPIDYVKKYISNIIFYCRNIMGMIYPLFSLGFIFGLLNIKKNIAGNILLIIALLISFHILLLSYSYALIRYFVIFIPLVIILGLGVLFDYYRGMTNRIIKKVALFLIMLFLFNYIYYSCINILGNLPNSHVSFESVNQQKAIGEFIKNNTGEYDIIATDYLSIMWYGDRKTLFLPISFQELDTIDKKYRPINAILLSASSLTNRQEISTGIGQKMAEWRKIIDNHPKILGEYKLIKAGFIKGEKIVFYKKMGRKV